MGSMSILLSLGAGWPIPSLDRGVILRALQTPIWWPLHGISNPSVLVFPEGKTRDSQLEGYELILCHGRRVADNALGRVTMP